MDEQVFQQAVNVASLPGIVGASHCMPDAHWGYGFPIGGVAAMDVRSGVISPGGIGFDINCGMRLVRTDLTWPEVKPHLGELVDALQPACRPVSAATASCESAATSSGRCCEQGLAGPFATAAGPRRTFAAPKPRGASRMRIRSA